MLKYLNPYFWIGAAAIAAAAWGAWQWQGHSHYKAGQTAERSIWEERDRVALAAGEATTKLLARNAIIQTETFHEKLKGIEQQAAAQAVGLSHALRTADELRVALDERAAAPPSSTDSCPAARSDEVKLRSCESVLGAGLALASGAGRLVDEGENLLERADITITALQDWSRLVQSANEAP